MTTPTPPAIDRRPIASRERTVWKRAAGALVRAGVSPNHISIVGMLACIGAGVLLAMTADVEQGALRRGLWLAAGVLVQVRLICNMLDGMVAIESGRASPVGELYNEVPDRVSDTATFIGLGYAGGGHPDLGFIATCAALFVAYVRAQGKAAGAHNDFSGPMAKQHRMFLVTLVALYLALTPASWQPAWGASQLLGLPAVALGVIVAGCVITAIRRLIRISAALRGRAGTDRDLSS